MKKKSGKKDIKKPEKPKIPESTANEEPGKAFDFGGLPDRDLKKNLGCG